MGNSRRVKVSHARPNKNISNSGIQDASRSQYTANKQQGEEEEEEERFTRGGVKEKEQNEGK